MLRSTPHLVYGVLAFSTVEIQRAFKSRRKADSLLIPLKKPQITPQRFHAQRVWPSQQCPRGRGYEGLRRTRAPSHRSLSVVFGLTPDKPIKPMPCAGALLRGYMHVRGPNRAPCQHTHVPYQWLFRRSHCPTVSRGCARKPGKCSWANHFVDQNSHATLIP